MSGQVDAELCQLETDIARIEDEIIAEKNQYRLKNQWRDYHHGRRGPADKMDNNIEELKQQVEFLKMVTGVTISDVNTTIISEDILSVKKKRIISGNCDDTLFKLDMDVEESMDLDANVKSKITHLSISASENMYQDLKDCVEKLADQGNAQGFMSLLRPYNTWVKNRDVTYEHFMKKYPEIVSRPKVEVLRMSHPKKKCTFEITWGFKMTHLYNVLPDIKLTVQVPKQLTDSNKDILESVPEKLHLMLELLGIEQTFNSLVSLLQ